MSKASELAKLFEEIAEGMPNKYGDIIPDKEWEDKEAKGLNEEDEVEETKEVEVNEAEEDEEEDPKALALIDYLHTEGDDEIKEANNTYGNEYETAVGDFLVYDNYEEAKYDAVEQSKQILEDTGISGVNFNNMNHSMEYFVVDSDWFQKAMHESNETYVADMNASDKAAELRGYDIVDEDEFREDHREELQDAVGLEEDIDDLSLAEMLDTLDMINDYDVELVNKLDNNCADPIEWYIDNFGQEDFNKVIIEKGLVDLDAVAEECVEIDGAAHMLASYDGKDRQHNYNGVDYYIFRTN